MTLDVRVLRTLTVPTPAGPGHVSAASSLVRRGGRLFVVADDEHRLAEFEATGDQPGCWHRLFDGELPDAHQARKAAKPDLEALALLPPFAGFPQGALLALGSGSRPQRQRAVLLAPGEMGAPQPVDLAPLYAPLRARHPMLNIEGAFVGAGRFCLLQRGNASHRTNLLIRYDWPAVQAWLGGHGPAPEVVDSMSYDLGELDGVPLGFTDAAALPDGGWVFCAAAEATDDNYLDGACRGSAVGVVAPDGRLRSLQPLSLRCKAEGIAVAGLAGALQLLLVTDPDYRREAALLLAVTLAPPSADPDHPA